MWVVSRLPQETSRSRSEPSPRQSRTLWVPRRSYWSLAFEKRCRDISWREGRMPHVRKSRATVVAFACLGSIITFASVASAQANHDKAVAAFEDARKLIDAGNC